ncbi:MAG: diguanylate cyclase [Myxococcota bacterium]|nr:diguanylate cyclase [Myxococcota bacterium]
MSTVAQTERRSIQSKRRLDSIFETLAGYLILLGINYYWFRDQLGWVDLSLHPYFVVVLLISSRYGTVDGIVAGSVGAALLTAFKMQVYPEVFKDASGLLDLQQMYVPYLLILLGAVLGEVRQVAEEEVDTLSQRLKVMRSDLEHITSENKQVRRYNEDLQERIASSTETSGAFYEAAAKVQSLALDDAVVAILDMVVRFVDADQCAIYDKLEGGWKLRQESGWSDIDEFERQLPNDEPILQLVATGRVTSVLDVGDDARTEILLAAPILAEGKSDKPQVVAAITIQSMPLQSMTAGAIRTLSGIAEWSSRVFSTANRFRRVRERDPADEITGTYRYGYLIRRLDDECARWRRYQERFPSPTTLILVRIHNFERIPRAKRAVFLRRMGRLLLRCIRGVDLVARWKSADTFALLLPSTENDGGRILASRVMEQFRRDVLSDVPRSAELSLRIGIGTTGMDGDTKDDLIAAATREELALK